MIKPDLEEGRKIVGDLMRWLKIDFNESTSETPERVAKMYVEIFGGLYNDAPPMKVFDSVDDYVAVTKIPFNSMCEHHLLPFTGQCGIVYHSSGKVAGLSKFPRIVQHYASRPQLQERLTQQIAKHIFDEIKPHGVYVFMTASHSCMTIRGIKSHGSVTNTSALIGEIDKGEAIRLLTINNHFEK